MMKEVSVIVNTLISQIDNSVLGKYNALDERTYICDTKWMRVGKIVTDSLDRKYRVTEVVDDVDLLYINEYGDLYETA